MNKLPKTLGCLPSAENVEIHNLKAEIETWKKQATQKSEFLVSAMEANEKVHTFINALHASMREFRVINYNDWDRCINEADCIDMVQSSSQEARK